MKLITRLSLAAIILAATSTTGVSQTKKRDIGGGKGFNPGDVNVIPKTDPAKKAVKKVTTIQMIAVSPERVWKSSDKNGKPITGSLLAFAREKKTGKVSIVQDEKVRLLVGKKDYTVPLTKLSADDQAYVHNLEDSARIAGKLIEPAKTEDDKDGDAHAGDKKKAGEEKAPAGVGKKASVGGK